MLKIKTLVVTPFQQNCRLLLDEAKQEALVVDPGDNAEAIIKALEAYKVKAILLTHGHLDHVGAVGQLAAELSCPILGPHEDDAYLIENLDYQADIFSLKRSISFEPQYLADGQVLENLLDGVSFKVILTPGHTRGGICFYCQEQGFLLAGDTIFAGSIGRTDFEGGSFEAIEHSIRERIYTLADDTIIMPGHGPDTSVAQEKASNPFVRP